MHGKKKFLLLFLILPFVLTGCLSPGKDTSEKNSKTITYWRVFDGRDSFNKIIKKYNKRHPNVTIKYRKLRYENYREELLNAMAEDRGPDIFSINNSWMREYKSKISPMPEKVTVNTLTTQGTIKKEKVFKKKTKSTISLRELENNFLDVVYDDAVIESKKGKEEIYGLPLSVDTLALYYNKDLLNNAGIPSPPEYWNQEFQKNIKKLTKQNSKGNIVQSGVAMGGADNIERASDILAVLMMQNGATIMTDEGNVKFAQTTASGYNPGLEALNFYTDFANPAKEVYCWNSNMENSLKRFTEGKVAMMFGYSYHLPIIRSRAPKLNFSTAPLPQINNSQKVNFADYWMEVVSQKSEHKDVAWDFLMFAAKKDQVKTYLEATNKPTALRSLIEQQTQNQDIGVFAKQLLTAQSWYEGYKPLTAREIIRTMIKETNQSPEKTKQIIKRGASRVGQTAVK